MPIDPRDVLRVQAIAFNAHSLGTLGGQYRRALCYMDGDPMGQGPDAVEAALAQEWKDAVGRVVDLDGEPVLASFEGDEGMGRPRGVIQLDWEDDEIARCRIDHDPAALRRLMT